MSLNKPACSSSTVTPPADAASVITTEQEQQQQEGISNNTAATSQDQQQQQHHRSSSSSSITASPDQILINSCHANIKDCKENIPTATTLQNGNSSYMESTAACKSETNQPP
ncbi:hypothetical protein Peur_015015 [Populus x canadensis]